MAVLSVTAAQPIDVKTAFITGITGQDGAYLAQLLLSRGYRVIGGMRRSASRNLWRLEELGIHHDERLSLVNFDLLDAGGATGLLDRIHPDEVYNLAAQSSVSASFEEPMLTLQTVGAGPLQLLEGIRVIDPKIRFFQASSSEMFGRARTAPQDEETTFRPRTPYGAAKVYAHWMTVNYRETYGLFACCGILFNHESRFRSREFVTRKITDGVAKVKLGKIDCMRLGNLDARRDWGYAPEYVDAMTRIVQAPTAETYVLATGHTASVRDFAELAFRAAGCDIEFVGTGVEETAVDRKTGHVVIRVDPNFYRPAEVEKLVGNPERARSELGWQPSMSLDRICAEMVEADMRRNAAGVSL
jgi:GDPmannose 4,6-dehydratase